MSRLHQSSVAAKLPSQAQVPAPPSDGECPTPGERVSLELKAELLESLQVVIRSWNGYQRDAGNRIGVSQAKISRIMAGDLSNISVDWLVRKLADCGYEVRLTVNYKSSKLRTAKKSKG